MSHAPGSLSAELALTLLRDGPLGVGEICRRALALQGLPESMADRLCRTLLGEDPRFRRMEDGSWCLACTPSTVRPLGQVSFVVVDVETTGFSPPADRVIEIGCVRVENGRVVDSLETLINPRRPIPGPITSLTGISWSMLADKPSFEEICPGFLQFLGESIFVAHNAPFDWRFIQSEVSLAVGRKLLNERICTRALARRFLPEIPRHGLDQIAHFFNLEFVEGRHRALGDAMVTARVLLRFLERAAEQGIMSLDTLIEFLKPVRRSSGKRKS